MSTAAVVADPAEHAQFFVDTRRRSSANDAEIVQTRPAHSDASKCVVANRILFEWQRVIVWTEV
ncbi:hypothetical protein, partial [Streptomyces cadmiisoli]|uniref:hypothetical protein n=1 Tax=Streptomyces cadmiisoli TaxID=2184053 RepID=UPI003D706B75